MVENKLDKSTEAISKLKQENQELNKIIKNQEERVEQFESEIRRNNITLQGLLDSEEGK